jgi:hypothetical protein
LILSHNCDLHTLVPMPCSSPCHILQAPMPNHCLTHTQSHTACPHWHFSPQMLPCLSYAQIPSNGLWRFATQRSMC